MNELFIGLISGTSADGVDAALMSFQQPTPSLLGKLYQPYPAQLRKELLDLAHSDQAEFDTFYRLDRQVSEILAVAVTNLLKQSNNGASEIECIGSHGQTLRHRPDLPHPYTVQIGDPNLLTQLTGIPVVADFRRADMALGGQGAPFAPVFHQEMFYSSGESRVVLNLGGIANITVLDKQTGLTQGFDTGPASALMDDWIQLCQGKDFDRDGSWAASGSIDQALLSQFLEDPYFQLPPPKSTGREYFTPQWLHQQLNKRTARPSDTDIQTTLLELTAVTVSDAIKKYAESCRKVFICGGGAHNPQLCDRIARLLPGIKTGFAEDLGLDGDFIEAMTFAWLAWRHVRRLPVDLRCVTGSSSPVVCGAYYPGSTCR